MSWGGLGLTSVVGWVFLGLLVQELFFWGACVFVMGVWTCEGESGCCGSCLAPIHTWLISILWLKKLKPVELALLPQAGLDFHTTTKETVAF